MRWDVHYVDQTGSTNADLLDLARAGARVGTVVRAGHQTAGRGRLGRTWHAPPGTSLLASILLEAEPFPFVTVARVALAASDACRDIAGVDTSLKWPNDLLIGDRKLAGLLAEADGAGSSLVVGIGCNVNWPPPHGSGQGEPWPEDLGDGVAALFHVAAAVPSPAALLDGLLERLDGWLAHTSDEVLVAYRRRCATLGRAVRVILADGAFEGVASGITASGELEVAFGSATRLVRAGDVVHVRAG